MAELDPTKDAATLAVLATVQEFHTKQLDHLTSLVSSVVTVQAVQAETQKTLAKMQEGDHVAVEVLKSAQSKTDGGLRVLLWLVPSSATLAAVGAFIVSRI